MNVIFLLGNICNDLELETISGDKSMLRFNVAVKRKFKSKGEYLTDFFSCIAFGKQAELIAQYFHKGSRIQLQGEVNIEKYNEKYYTKVMVKDFNFIDKREQKEESFNDFIPKQEQKVIEVNDDDLPW